MSDIFQLTPQRPTHTHNHINTQQMQARYAKLQSDFLNKSYGYYSAIFIHQIVEEAKKTDSLFEVLNA